MQSFSNTLPSVRRKAKSRRTGNHGAMRLALLLAMIIVVIFAPISAGVSLAMAITGTAHGEGRAGQGDDTHYVPSVSDVITRIEPSDFPFVTFLNRLNRSKPAKQVKHSWGEVSRFERRDTIDGLTTAGGAGASKDIVVDGSVMWQDGDIFYAPDNGTTTGPFLVTAYNSSTLTLTVYKLEESTGSAPWTAEAYGTVPIFADGEALYWISNAKTEADNASPSRLLQPAYKFNYVQTFDALVEISDHRMRSENFGTDDWIRHRQDNLYEFRKSEEYAAVFNGAPSVTTDPNNNEKRWTMGGMRHYITTTATLANSSGVPTEAQIVDFIYDCFDDNGAKTKMLLAGTDFLKVVDKVNTNSSLHVTRDQKFAGVEVTTLRGRKGRLITAFHPGFDEMGIPDEGMVVDYNHLIKREFQPTERRDADRKKSGDLKDADAEYYIGKWTTEVRNSTAHRWCVLG